MIQFKNTWLNEIKRVVLSLAIAILFISLKSFVPSGYQLLFFKVILVSLAFTHAHIAGKLAFPKCYWDSYAIKPIHVIRIAIYVVFVYAYSVGG